MKEIKLDEFLKDEFSENQIDALKESIFYEYFLFKNDNIFELRGGHSNYLYKTFLDKDSIIKWIYEKIEYNDSYEDAIAEKGGIENGNN